MIFKRRNRWYVSGYRTGFLTENDAMAHMELMEMKAGKDISAPTPAPNWANKEEVILEDDCLCEECECDPCECDNGDDS